MLRHAEIVGIVDRDSQKWGLTHSGRTIVSPDVFLRGGTKERVVISSYDAETEIAHMLDAAGVAPERTVRLYG